MDILLALILAYTIAILLTIIWAYMIDLFNLHKYVPMVIIV